MKFHSLEFLDKEIETKFQDKESQSRKNLLKLYLAIKIVLATIELLFDWYNGDDLKGYTQGIIYFASFVIFLLVTMINTIRFSYMINFVQIAIPIINYFTISRWHVVTPLPIDNYYMLGVYKVINMSTLCMLGTNYISNCASFLFAAGLYSYMYFPSSITYNATNCIIAYIWLVVLKYISDKDRRQQYLLIIKDVNWTHIMKDMIDDWVVMVNHDSKKDQITVREANKNFRQSCIINDDESFRKFVRSIRILKPFDEDQTNNQELAQQIQESFKLKTTLQKLELKKCPNLEEILRDIIFQNVKIKAEYNHNLTTVLTQTQQDTSQQNETQQNVNQQVRRFIGVRFDQSKKEYYLYSIRLIKGSDSEPFIMIIIKEIKSQVNLTQKTNSQVMENNLIKMSTFCGQYLQLTEQIYNNQQKLPIKNLAVSSQILRLVNSHYVHQLYLNQMHNLGQFKIQSCATTINIKQMIRILKQRMNSQIHIRLIKKTQQQLIIKSFKQEVMHLFLIIIQNTIKHSEVIRPKLNIEVFEDSDVLTFEFQNQGQGITQVLLSELLDSYRISVSRKNKIQILNDKQFNHHVKQSMKYGWLAARLLLSMLGPNNDFVVTSNQEQGCSIRFSIYQNIVSIIQLHNLDKMI